jgi:hypothetical protein
MATAMNTPTMRAARPPKARAAGISHDLERARGGPACWTWGKGGTCVPHSAQKFTPGAISAPQPRQTPWRSGYRSRDDIAPLPLAGALGGASGSTYSTGDCGIPAGSAPLTARYRTPADSTTQVLR